MKSRKKNTVTYEIEIYHMGVCTKRVCYDSRKEFIQDYMRLSESESIYTQAIVDGVKRNTGWMNRFLRRNKVMRSMPRI